MNHRTAGKQRRAWVVAMAVAALPLCGAVTLPAYAQFPTGNDGRARDANNRVGSGGYNDAGPSTDRNGKPTANQVAEGNVTRGQSFRGGVVDRDPRAFRGVTAGRMSDLFIRDSSGAADLSAAPGGAYAPTTFYGRSRAVPPPPGSVALGATGGYVGGAPSGLYDDSRTFYTYRAATDRVYEREAPFSRYNQDRILQIPTADRPGDGGNDAGQVNGPIGPLTLSASPLYGVRQFGPNDRTSAEDFFNARTGRGGTERRDAFGIAIDDATIRQMQRELGETDLATGRPTRQDPSQQQQQQDDQGQSDTTGSGRGAPAPGAVQSLSAQPIAPLQGRGGPGTGIGPGAVGASSAGVNSSGSPGGGGAGGGVGTTQPPSPAGGPARPMQGGLQTGEGVTFRSVVPREQQTPAYRNLMARYQRASRQGTLTTAEQARWNNQLRRAQQAPAGAQAPGGVAARPGQTGLPGPRGTGGPAAPGGVAPPLPPGPDAAAAPGPNGTAGRTGPMRAAPNVPPPAPPIERGANAASAAPGNAAEAPPAPRPPSSEKPDKPVQIKSLAEGVKAPGLRDLLQAAEADLKAGRYDSAIEKYDSAQRVTVDNPLLALGQAHAELAATYYRRAEATLRRAVAADPALLYGQYDLRAFIGQERLEYIAKDLKDLAANNPQDVRPVLLLAYVAYNTGLEEQAAAFLDDAAKRAGGKDQTVDLLRRHWSLSGSASGTTNPAAPAPDLNK